MVIISDAERAAHGAAGRYSWCREVDDILRQSLRHLMPGGSCVAAAGAYALEDMQHGRHGQVFVSSNAHHIQYIIEAIQNVAPSTAFLVDGRGLTSMSLAGARKLWGSSAVPPMNRQPDRIRQWAGQMMEVLATGWAVQTHQCAAGPGGVADWRTLRYVLAAAGQGVAPLEVPDAISRLLAGESLGCDLEDVRPDGLHDVVAEAMGQLVQSGDLLLAANRLRAWL